MDFQIGGSTKVAIDNSGFVGIAEASPSRKLHINGPDGTTNLVEGNSRTVLFLDNAGATYINLASSNSANAGMFFSDTDANNRIDPDDIIFRPNLWSSIHKDGVFNIKEPSIDYGSSQFDFIKNYINEFETLLFSQNFDDPISGYESYIDVNSFIDWYLINEIAKSVDARWYSSIYFSYIPGEKIKMGPIWDFDLSYGNLNYSDAQYTYDFYIRQNNWISRLFDDPKFEEKVKNRFLFYYNKLDEFKETIDNYADYLDKSQKANFDRWDILGVYVWPNPVWNLTYKQEVDRLKNWIVERMNWLNTNY